MEKIQFFRYLDCIDCSTTNILYLATCRLCSTNLQYAGSARDINEQIVNIKVEKHEEEIFEFVVRMRPATWPR